MSSPKPPLSLWTDQARNVTIIDQTLLPFERRELMLCDLDAFTEAICAMRVRGAPLIGVTAAFGLAVALQRDSSDTNLEHAHQKLLATRPTAVNLQRVLQTMNDHLETVSSQQRAEEAWRRATIVFETELRYCEEIGTHGSKLIASLHREKQRPINILTHCNAGWLATVGWGTALAPIYLAHAQDVPLHVWVDETRPRNQGALLTAWELADQKVDHTVIVDNAGGHLMQHGQVDMCIVGSDRTTSRGDVCNKIGTYLKALAAADNGVPFYAALPETTVDWELSDGVAEIPIEQREAREVTHLGRAEGAVRVVAPNSRVRNDAFDVTPAHLVTGLITERGVCEASANGLQGLYRAS